MPAYDDDFEIPEITDFTGWEVGRYARKPGEGPSIQIDGAVEYSLRLIPSAKVVGWFATTYEAWPAVLAELDRGIPGRLLMLDWHGSDGTRGRVSSGRLLASVARSGIGRLEIEEPVPAAIRAARPTAHARAGAAETTRAEPPRWVAPPPAYPRARNHPACPQSEVPPR
jgi:hypothetical protein